LAKAEMVRPPTMSRVVDALETAGLARRKVNATDRRAILIEPTAEGAALLHAGRQRRVKFLASHLARLNASERKHIDIALAAIHKALMRRN
jgi:DNA-binding MarR family transcriptional regulator